ncbi:MAG: hypothetical protein J6Q67_08910 [Clostridia bacterium]|nr:hypothetical protein [Clostridia bacterium]
MKIVLRLTALVLAMLMCLSFVGCHKKDEIALTIEGNDFTAAYYLCALVFADSEARSKIDAELSGDVAAAAEGIDYHKQTIDNKNFVTWVEDTAVDNLKKIAACKNLCKDNKLELDKDTKEMAEYYAEYYWNSYGYATFLEPNGVALSTFKTYMTDTYYSEEYFDFIYGEGGEKEADKETLKEILTKKYLIVDMIEVDFTTLKDDEIKAKTEFINKAAEDLRNGKKNFETVLKEYVGPDEEEDKKEETLPDPETPQPKDINAEILGAEDTEYASDYFKDTKDMKVGEVKVKTLDEKKGIVLFVKGDIAGDEYYYGILSDGLRHVARDEEFDEQIKKGAEPMKLEKNDYVIKRLKVKNITYPEATE